MHSTVFSFLPALLLPLANAFPSVSTTSSGDNAEPNSESYSNPSDIYNVPLMDPSCPQLELVFVRGVFEPGHDCGIVGEPLAASLQSLIGPGVTSYAVKYPHDTNIEGTDDANSGATRAADDAVGHMEQVNAVCPYTLFAIGGFSEGAVAVHDMYLSPELQEKVVAVTLFGDPFRRQNAALPIDDTNDLYSACAVGDSVCENGGNHLTSGSHLLTYSQDYYTTRATGFIFTRCTQKFEEIATEYRYAMAEENRYAVAAADVNGNENNGEENEDEEDK